MSKGICEDCRCRSLLISLGAVEQLMPESVDSLKLSQPGGMLLKCLEDFCAAGMIFGQIIKKLAHRQDGSAIGLPQAKEGWNSFPSTYPWRKIFFSGIHILLKNPTAISAALSS